MYSKITLKLDYIYFNLKRHTPRNQPHFALDIRIRNGVDKFMSWVVLGWEFFLSSRLEYCH